MAGKDRISIQDVLLEKGLRKDGSPWYSMRFIFNTPLGKQYDKRIFIDDKDLMILGLEDSDFMTFVRRSR